MFRFSIRDVLWLTVVVGLSVALYVEHQQMSRARLAWERQLRENAVAVLNATTSVDFVQTPLVTVAEYLSSHTGLRVVMKKGVDGSTLVTGKINDTALNDGLQQMLSEHGLSFQTKAGAIFIERKP